MDVAEIDDDDHGWQCAVCDCRFQITWVSDGEGEGSDELNLPALVTGADYWICEQCMDLFPEEYRDDLENGFIDIEEILPSWREGRTNLNFPQ